MRSAAALPGGTVATIEAVPNADIGAVLWYDFPISVIEQRALTRLPSQVGQRLEAQVVGPLQVFEHEHRRFGRPADEVDHLHHEVTPPRCRGAEARRGDLEQVAADLPERRIATHGAPEVEEGRREDVAVLRRDLGLRESELPLDRDLPDRPEQPRLADPGLTGQEQELALAGADFAEPAIGQRDEVIAAHDQR